ncbi:putative protein GLUTAMINE DUMPER 2 [Iris pallida]|uniref:Uncharacterized protein n=1 Tax=Iris pallida TaxID=29817 RepID=A0AAX6ID24_IRIPA|nr:putative protein GLUTAMINE DUMPER 2 [Iris pallida]KAJ6850813.1 putative protein GLUTAMINE DUMPER 2 [Iris pallida]
MRTSIGFNATVVAAPVAATEAVARGGGSTHSAWNSPVPYLFGGLAAMLGLIAFALLILACSYWKLSGFLENGGDSAEESSKESEEKPAPAWYEERIVVIMAGEEKPRYLATPICSRASSMGGNSSSSSSSSTTSSSTSSDDYGRSRSRDIDGEVDGKKAADDVVIEAEALKSNLEDRSPAGSARSEQQAAESISS